MKEISIQALHQDTVQWVKQAAGRESIIITDNGRPVATLSAFEAARLPARLPDREDRIRRRSLINVDSGSCPMEWSSGLKMAHRPDTVGGRGGGAYDYRYEGHILGSIHVMGTSRFYGSANCVILGCRLANSYPKH